MTVPSAFDRLRAGKPRLRRILCDTAQTFPRLPWRKRALVLQWAVGAVWLRVRIEIYLMHCRLMRFAG